MIQGAWTKLGPNLSALGGCQRWTGLSAPQPFKNSYLKNESPFPTNIQAFIAMHFKAESPCFSGLKAVLPCEHLIQDTTPTNGGASVGVVVTSLWIGFGHWPPAHTNRRCSFFWRCTHSWPLWRTRSVLAVPIPCLRILLLMQRTPGSSWSAASTSNPVWFDTGLALKQVRLSDSSSHPDVTKSPTCLSLGVQLYYRTELCRRSLSRAQRRQGLLRCLLLSPSSACAGQSVLRYAEPACGLTPWVLASASRFLSNAVAIFDWKKRMRFSFHTRWPSCY